MGSFSCADGCLVAVGSNRQGEPESGAAAVAGVDTDGTAVQLDDFLTDRQPDTGSGVGVPAVQTLENDKHFFGDLRRDADAVVRHAEYPMAAVITAAAFAVDHDARDAIVASELDRVANEVLPQHRYEGGVADDLR